MKNNGGLQVLMCSSDLPYKQNVEAKDLIAEYSVLFTNESMYQSFYNKYGVGENKDSRWQFDSTTMTAIFSF